MSHNSQACLPEIRQLLILNLVRHTGRNGVAPYEIRDCLYEWYPGETPEAVHRRFSDDMKALKTAGLIAYIHLRPSSTVTLAVPQKDRSLFLSADEHYALIAARERLRWRSTPSPIDAALGAPKLDLMLRAVRLMEEQTVDVNDIAGMLNVKPAKVRELMNRLDGVRPRSELLTKLVTIERGDAADRPIAGLVRIGPDDNAPFQGRGLDEVGLFAYSRAEVDDRLALITAARNHPDTPEVEIMALRSAEGKLQQWRRKLGLA